MGQQNQMISRASWCSCVSAPPHIVSCRTAIVERVFLDVECGSVPPHLSQLCCSVWWRQQCILRDIADVKHASSTKVGRKGYLAIWISEQSIALRFPCMWTPPLNIFRSLSGAAFFSWVGIVKCTGCSGEHRVWRTVHSPLN